MNEFHNKIINTNIVIPDYPKYSNDCIETLLSLLDKDQYNRISMDEIINLNWFNNNLINENPDCFHDDILAALLKIEKTKLIKNQIKSDNFQ